MNKLTSRKQIIEEAKTWLGTPFHPQAGVKHVGVDCAYLIGKTALNTGCIESFLVPAYDFSWAAHTSEEFMCNLIESFGATRIEEAKPGDILCFQYGRACSHMGIMIEDGQFIHGHAKVGRVVVNSLNGEYLDRLKRVYQFPNIED